MALELIPCMTHKNQLNPTTNIPVVPPAPAYPQRQRESQSTKQIPPSSWGSCHCMQLWVPSLIQYVVWTVWDLGDGWRITATETQSSPSESLWSMKGRHTPGSCTGAWKEAPTNHKIRLLKNSNLFLGPERKGQWGTEEVACRKEGTHPCKAPGAGASQVWARVAPPSLCQAQGGRASLTMAAPWLSKPHSPSPAKKPHLFCYPLLFFKTMENSLDKPGHGECGVLSW